MFFLIKTSEISEAIDSYFFSFCLTFNQQIKYNIIKVGDRYKVELKNPQKLSAFEDNKYDILYFNHDELEVSILKLWATRDQIKKGMRKCNKLSKSKSSYIFKFKIHEVEDVMGFILLFENYFTELVTQEGGFS